VSTHLIYNVAPQGESLQIEPWCDKRPSKGEHATRDPLAADCPECLRRAASMGAAAAMRCAAVEAGASKDEELVQERDKAIEELTAIKNRLIESGLFECTECRAILPKEKIGYSFPPAIMCCATCAATVS